MLKKKQAELNSACFTDHYRKDIIASKQQANDDQQHLELKYRLKLGNRSKSASPFRSTPLFTIPEPFQMTQRLCYLIYKQLGL